MEPGATTAIAAVTAMSVRAAAPAAASRTKVQPAAAPADAADVATPTQTMFSVFTVDPKTHATHIAVYDGTGNLVRMLPPASVAEMLEQMARYRPVR